MYFNFLKYQKIYFIFSGLLILGSLICLILFGLKPGIDFTGGSILEIRYEEERPSHQEIRENLAQFDLGKILVQSAGQTGVIIRMKDISEETHQKILEKLRESRALEELRFESIGPFIGRELKEKTKLLIIIALLAIVVYVALAFRRLPKPIKSWWLSIAALIALFHDVLIPLGTFSILGKFFEVPITIPVVVALLTVMGYSINDTVVVFDRMRENLLRRSGVTFEETLNRSLNQTLGRSINTSLTTLLVLVAIFFFGGTTLRYFSLALMIGIIAGTYSSIFLAPPLLAGYLRRKRS